MKELFKGILEFKEQLDQETKVLFGQLAREQKPKALFITCSDSRLVPSLVASSKPGELFIVRNVGNLVPENSSALEESSVAAALEFSILSLKVPHIVICGHSECGAMQALLDGAETPHVGCWIRHGEGALERLRSEKPLTPKLSEVNQLSQLNVLEQMEHLKTYPFIAKRLKEGTLHIHGLWFDIASAESFTYDEALGKFVAIENYSET